MGQAAYKAELKAKGHQQLDEGKQKLKSSVGQAVAATAAMAIPTKVSADYGAIIRDIAIKSNIANKPEEAQMSKKIIDTSRDTGMARNDVAEVVNALVGAGMELDKALSYAPTAAKFAVGQGSDGGETAKMINALSKLSDESPKVVTGIGAAVAAVIAFQSAMSTFKIAKGLLNIGRGSLMGNPNIPQKVIVVGGGGGGGLEAGDLDAEGKDGKKGKKGGRSSRGRGRSGGGGRSLGVGSAVKGAAVVAVVDAGFKAYDTYQNAETQDDKAEGYGAAAGGLAGTLSGAAAGAALGTLLLPVIGTAIGGLVGGVLGNMGGDVLGGYLGKAAFGTPDDLKRLPAAGPLMMANAGKDIPPVLGGIAQSFAPSTTGPLMLTNPGAGPGASVAATSAAAAPIVPAAPPVSYDPRDLNSKDAMLLPHFANKVRFPGSELRRPKVIRSGLEDPPPQPGEAAKAMMLPPASADAAAGALVKPMAAKAEAPKVESNVAIQAPFSLTVNGDVKDGNQLFAQIKPQLDQYYRDMAKQVGSAQLFDAPHV